MDEQTALIYFRIISYNYSIFKRDYKTKRPTFCRAFCFGTSEGIRTPVTAVRGRRPRPLDHGGIIPRDRDEPAAARGTGTNRATCDIIASGVGLVKQKLSIISGKIFRG